MTCPCMTRPVGVFGGARDDVCLLSPPLFAGRVGKHCQDRWNTKLGLDHSVWAEEEYRILSDAHAALGKDWQGIAALLPGRTGQQVKAYFERYPSTEAAGSENANRSPDTQAPVRRKRKSNPTPKQTEQTRPGGGRMKRLKPDRNAQAVEGEAVPRQVLADSTNGQASPVSVVSVVSDIAFQKLPITLHTAVAVNQGHQQCTPPRPDRHCLPTDAPQRAPNRARSAPRNPIPDGKAAVESLAESTVGIVSSHFDSTMEGIEPLADLPSADGRNPEMPRFTDTVISSELNLVRPQAQRPRSTAPVNIRLRRGLAPLNIVNPETILRAALTRPGRLDE